jgi:hypothetical protein
LKKFKARKTPKKLERNLFTKFNGHPNLTQNPTGSGSCAKFHPRVQIQVSNSTRLHFFAGRIFNRPDLLPSLSARLPYLVLDGVTSIFSLLIINVSSVFFLITNVSSVYNIHNYISISLFSVSFIILNLTISNFIVSQMNLREQNS